jgi:hypothetical protein
MYEIRLRMRENVHIIEVHDVAGVESPTMRVIRYLIASLSGVHSLTYRVFYITSQR